MRAVRTGVMALLMAAGAAAWGDEPKIELVTPAVDKASGTVTLPAAFWNEKMRTAVEVALCGRPSDFLHETILSVTTTQAMLAEALRQAGCHDADAWASTVSDFPRVRGDRLLILASFERNGKKETYALDELLSFEGWGVSIGPYGWMFKGDPEHRGKGAAPAPVDGKDLPIDPLTQKPYTAAGLILRDDPQAALIFTGLQHMSQSFIDHPLAYDQWVYAIPDMARNVSVLPQEVFDSNGSVPVTLTLKKVTEAEFLEGIAAVWHDAAFAEYARKQLPVAKEIDAEKAALWGKLEALRKLASSGQPAAMLSGTDEARDEAVLEAKIAAGYAALDAAWAAWAADHANFDPKDDDFAAEKEQARLWKEHGELWRERAKWLAEAAVDEREGSKLQVGIPDAATQEQIHRARGKGIGARAEALLAEIKQPREKWAAEMKKLEPDDPRTDWVKGIRLQNALLDAEARFAAVGQGYSKAIADKQGERVAALAYARAQMAVTVAELEVDLADTDFELSKRADMPEDADVKSLKAKKERIEGELKAARAAEAGDQPGAATQQ